MQYPIKRFRLRPRSAGFVALSAVLLLTVSATAGADTSNLLPNGSFQSGTSGWTTTNAALTIASDGVDDSSAGRVALNSGATSYQLSASPRPVTDTTADAVYTANGVIRSDTPGNSVCLTLKEVTSGGTLVLTSNQCVSASSQWAPLPQTSLTAVNDGDVIRLLVHRPSHAVAGESFEVDTLSLVASGGTGDGSPPSTPTNVSASAVSSNEIDVGWSASTDPDPDGVAGYAIYRDGGATSIGTVGGSTTSFADTSVGPGETHTYTVAAFDPESNFSSQSTPSNPATTPANGSPPSIPTNVAATAVGPNEIDVSWTASTDPDPDGVAGYAIYRDGGGTPLGTVNASATSFADTSVGPGETHTYTVAAFDPESNFSSQSTPSNPATTPLASGNQVGLWHLDELIGPTAHDSSGHGNDGAMSGPVTPGVPGKIGTAFSFVPKSAITVPDAADLRPGTADITISYWVNTTVAPAKGDYDMFVKGSSTTRSNSGEIKLEVQPNGQASCAFFGSLGGKQLQAGPNVFDGQWHQVTCQRIGNQIVEKVDGATFAVTKATGAITVTDPVRIGSHEGGGDWYKGLLDEVTYSIG